MRKIRIRLFQGNCLFVILVLFLSATTVKAQMPVFEWAKQVGGTNIDRAVSIAVDNAGNTYTTGRFSGAADFDPGSGTFSISSFGGNDVFITKLDVAGNFVWAKRIGGPNNEETLAIALDASGNIYVTGIFNGTTDFDPGVSVFNLTRLGGVDVFICKLDPAGDFVWAKQFGGNDLNYVRSLIIDGDGNVLTTGEFEGTTDFDPGVAVFNLTTLPSDVNAFICKLNSNGDFVWAKQIVGNALDQGFSIATDNSNNVYTTGLFELTADFDPGPGTFDLTSAGDQDCFISKLDTDGNFVWAKRIGGTGRDAGYALAIDAAGNVLTTGFFGFLGTSADFDPGAGNFILTSAGSADIFISKLDNAGNFVWAKQMGGAGNDIGYSIALDGTGNPYVTGQFQGTADFDPGTGTFNLVSGSSSNIYISKLDPAGNFDWAKAFVSTSSGVGRALAIDNSNNIYSAGIFSGTFDFDPDATLFNLTSFGSDDAWVHKLSQQLSILPTITSFSPTAGTIGTTITITGTNFSATPASNTVAFNGTPAVVTASTATSITTTVPVGATTGKITVTVAGNTATSATDFTVTATTNQPPIISPNTASVPINGIVVVDLLSLLSDPDDNLDLSTLTLLTNTSEQGATATILASFELQLNYGGVAFIGIDRVSLEVCDLMGACAQQELSIEVGSDVTLFNALSPNDDGKNDFFFIQYIDLLPQTQNNRVTIYNRWGDVVWEGSDYDNATVAFDGTSTNGKDLPPGTYFYKIEFSSGLKPITGFLSLKR